jgi:hypothetical protein
VTIRGTVEAGAWIVEAMTAASPEGGFIRQIGIMQGPPGQPPCGHAFAHHRTFDADAPVVLDGLREGMLRIDRENRHAFHV